MDHLHPASASASGSLSSSPPSAHCATLLRYLEEVCRAPTTSASGPTRTRQYQQLFDHLKHDRAQREEDGTPTDDAPSDPPAETPSDLESTCGVLPAFYRRLVADVHRVIRPTAGDTSEDEQAPDGHSVVTVASPTAGAASGAPPSTSVVVVAPRDRAAAAADRARQTLSVARAAVKTLGFFLHHPTYCSHFPLSATAESASKRRRIEQPHATPDTMEDVGTAAAAAASSVTLDGMVVLTEVLSHTSDRPLACLICWSLAEQCLLAPILARYVDRCIDAFVAAVERCQANALASAIAIGSPTAAAAATAPLLAEVLHALWKFARLCPSTLRARCRRNESNALRWLKVLIIQPYLTPIFFFDAANKEADAELKRIALLLLDLCVGTNRPKADASLAPVSQADAAMSGAEFLLREVSVNASVYGFCLDVHRLVVQEGQWVKAIVSSVQSREKALEAQRNEGRKPMEERKAETTDTPMDGTPSAAGGSLQPITQEQYESRLTGVYEEAFALLSIYLQCMGKIATNQHAAQMISATATPAASHSPSIPPVDAAAASSAPTSTQSIATAAAASTSAAASINSFLSFYQPAFNHPLPSIRQAVFVHAWKSVCRVLNVEHRPLLTPAQIAALPEEQRRRPLPPASFFVSRNRIALSMKPFVHQLGKERDPSVVGAILSTWLEVLVECFVQPSTASASLLAMAAPSSHRLQSSSIYAECVGPILEKLAGTSTKLPFESTASSAAGGSAWDSARRTRLWEELLDGLTWVGAPAAVTATPSHGTATAMESGGEHSTSMHTASTTSTSSSSSSSSSSPPSPPPPASWLPTLLHVLLVQPLHAVSRQSFLRSLTGLLAKSVVRIGGPSERKAFMAVYEHLMETAGKEYIGMRAHESAPLLSAHSPAQAAGASASKDAPVCVSLAHALYRGWQQSVGIESLLKPPPVAGASFKSPAVAPPSVSTPALLTDRQFLKLQFALEIQSELLKQWLRHGCLAVPATTSDELTNLGLAWHEDGSVGSVKPIGLSSAAAAESGYNATPTPCSAPIVGGVSTSSPTQQPHVAVSPPLVCLFARWMRVCSPLVHPTTCARMTAQQQEKLRRIFLDGVKEIIRTHMTTAGVASSSSPPTDAFGRSAQCFGRLMDLAQKLAVEEVATSNACWLVWQLVVTAQANLVDSLLPNTTPHAGGGDSSPSLPTGSAASASLDGPISLRPPSSKSCVDKLAGQLSQFILQRAHTTTAAGAGDECEMVDISRTPKLEEKEAAVESLVHLMLTSVRLVDDDGRSFASCSEENVTIDWHATFHPLSHRILQLAVLSSTASTGELPDIMAMLVQALVECQASLAASLAAVAPSSPAASKLPMSQGFQLLLLLSTSLLNVLHPSSPSVVAAARFASPAAVGNSGGNWKSWKSSPDSFLQKWCSGLMEEAARRSQMKRQATSDRHLLPDCLAPFFTELQKLFTRFSHSPSCIDAVAWFLRVLPGFHALLTVLETAKSTATTADVDSTPASSSSSSLMTVIQRQPAAEAFIELWSHALTAFRKNFHGALDLQLLQTAVGNIATTTATADSTMLAPKPLHFVDTLTLGLGHALPLIRSTSLHYWMHTYASKRHHHGGTPASTLKFAAWPELVQVGANLVQMGELKQQHAPQLAPPSTPTIGAPSQASLPGTPSTHAGGLLSTPSSTPGGRTPGRTQVSMSPTSESAKASAAAAAGAALDVDLNSMEDDKKSGGDDMNLQFDEAPLSATTTRSVLTSPHTPLNTAHSFLSSSKKKRTNLLDRLSGLHALPPEQVIVAPAHVMSASAVPSPFVIGASPSMQSQMEEQPPPAESTEQQQQQGQSTLSPFPGTPAAAPADTASKAPVTAASVAPSSVHSCSVAPILPIVAAAAAAAAAHPLGRTESDVAPPRALATAFESVVAPLATHNEQASHAMEDVKAGAGPAEFEIPEEESPPPMPARAVSANGVDQKPATTAVQPAVPPSFPPSAAADVAGSAAGGASSPPVAVDAAPSLSLPNISQAASQLPMPLPEEETDDEQEDRRPTAREQDHPESAAPMTMTASEILPLTSHTPVAIQSQPLLASEAPTYHQPDAPAAHSEPASVKPPPGAAPSTSPSPAIDPIAASKQDGVTSAGVAEDEERAVERPMPMEVEPEADPLVEHITPLASPVAAAAEAAPLAEETPIVPVETGLPENNAQPDGEKLDLPLSVAAVPPPQPDDSLPAPKARKRPLDALQQAHDLHAHVVSPTPASKRVMFCDANNVAISPSPSAYTASEAASQDHTATTVPTATEPPPFTLSPVTPSQLNAPTEGGGDIDMDHAENKYHQQQVDTRQLERAKKQADRAEKLLHHASKKALVKAQVQQPPTSPGGQVGPRPSILKSPTKSVSPTGASGSESQEGASSLYPSLASCLSPLGSLVPHFPLEAARGFSNLFASRHLVTVGDVAQSSVTSFQTNVPASLRVYLARSAHREDDDAGEEESAPATRIARLIVDALNKFDQEKEERAREGEKEKKRKGSPTQGAEETAAAANGTAEPSSKRTKLVGPIESLQQQTTQQQEAWLEKMMFASGTSSAAASSGVATQTQTGASTSTARPIAAGEPLSSGGSETPAFVAPDVTFLPAATPQKGTDLSKVQQANISRMSHPPTTAAAAAPAAPPSSTLAAVAHPSAPVSVPAPLSQPTPLAPASDSPPAMVARTDASMAIAGGPARAVKPIATKGFAPIVIGPGGREEPMEDVEAPSAGAPVLLGEADADMADVGTEPVATQVEQATLYLQHTMGLLYAPLQAMHPAAAPATSVLQQMNLQQLASLQSYVRALDSSLQQQIGKQRRSHTPTKPATPTRGPPRSEGASPRAAAAHAHSRS